MTKLEEMAAAARNQRIEDDLAAGFPVTADTRQVLPLDYRAVIRVLKVLRDANTAMKTAGVVSKDRYGSVADIFESMIDAVLAEAPK